MSSQETSISLIKKVYNHTLKSLKNNPALFLPFFIFAVFEFIALIFIYLAPRAPLNKVFGPPIRVFWGEGFLHYPVNFLLLPKLAFLSRMFLYIFLGSLLTGMAVAIISDIHHKKHLNLKACFKTALKNYIYLFTIVFIISVLFYFLVKITNIALVRYFIAGHRQLLLLSAKMWLGPLSIAINFIFGLLIQSIFIYAIPLLIIANEKFNKAIIKSFALFKGLFIPTIILVGLPMLIYIPIIVLQYNSAVLINKLFPESVLYVLICGIIISALAIDPLVTISTTQLYLINKEKQ